MRLELAVTWRLFVESSRPVPTPSCAESVPPLSTMGLSCALPSTSTPPAFTVAVPVPAAAAAPRRTMPPLIVSPPLKVFAPSSSSIPPPLLVTLPAPAIGPRKTVEPDWLIVSAEPPSAIAPAPLSELKVCA